MRGKRLVRGFGAKSYSPQLSILVYSPSGEGVIVFLLNSSLKSSICGCGGKVRTADLDTYVVF